MVTQYFEKAWKAYKNNFWQIAGAMSLFFIILFALIFVSIIPMIGAFTPSMLSDSEVSIESAAGTKLVADLLPVVNPYMILLSLALLTFTFFVIFAMGAGLVRVYADALKGKARIEIMFSTAKEKFVTVAGAQLIVMLVLLILYAAVFGISYLLAGASEMLFFVYLMLLIIPVVLFVILFSLVNQAIVIDDCGVIDSIKKSFGVVSSNYLEFLALVLIGLVISIIVSLIPILGDILSFILVAPILGMAYTAFYIDKAQVGRKIVKKKVKMQIKVKSAKKQIKKKVNK